MLFFPHHRVKLSTSLSNNRNHQRDGTQKPERKKKRKRKGCNKKKTGLDQVGDKRYFWRCSSCSSASIPWNTPGFNKFYFCLIFYTGAHLRNHLSKKNYKKSSCFTILYSYLICITFFVYNIQINNCVCLS
jgi:hypothetical protein